MGHLDQRGSVEAFDMEGQKFSDMPVNCQLLLCVFYEYQHLAGRDILSYELALHYFTEAIEEFGSMEAAVAAIMDRCGIDPNKIKGGRNGSPS